jgi:transcriptional regulator with XRE-family HTH domain
MKERILEFLKAENKSSAQLAEEIGVQPSGISHILSGRNNPSLDFVLKMIEKYQFISTDWLLFGKGSMYKDNKIQTLFDDPPAIDSENFKDSAKNEHLNALNGNTQPTVTKAPERSSIQSQKQLLSVKKIVWFFEDNSFEEYIPRD